MEITEYQSTEGQYLVMVKYDNKEIWSGTLEAWEAHPDNTKDAK